MHLTANICSFLNVLANEKRRMTHGKNPLINSFKYVCLVLLLYLVSYVIRTSKVQLRKIPRVKNLVQIERNATFYPFLTHADHIQHVRAREQPIEIKRKRSSKYSTAHGLSNDTNCVHLAYLVN